MRTYSLGKITTTPGTPVRVSTDPTLRVKRLRFVPVPGGTGISYVGVAGNAPNGQPDVTDFPMNKTTYAGVVMALPPFPTASQVERLELVADSDYGVQVSNYYIDVDAGSNGLIVSYDVE